MTKYSKEGQWMFLYYPQEKIVFMLFNGVRKGFWPYGTPLWEAIANSMSNIGIEEHHERDWQSFYIDTAITKDWKEADKIAHHHFGVPTFDELVERVEQGIIGREG